MRNMRSVGIDLSAISIAGCSVSKRRGRACYGFEMHLARMNRDIEQFQPAVIVVDPISAFRGPSTEIHATLVRLADICKTKGITALFTSLSSVGDLMDDSERSVSSLMDTWISLQDLEANGERNRVLYLLKSRGMNHSNQLREYRSDRSWHRADRGVCRPGWRADRRRPPGAGGSRARVCHREAAATTDRRRREVARKRAALERQIAEMRAEIEAEADEVTKLIEQEDARETAMNSDRRAMAASRGAR